MAEDQPAPESQDTPATEPAAPDTGTPATESTEDSSTQPEVNYEQRYTDLRSHNSRVESENAEFRRFVEALSDPDLQPQVLRAFGIELEDEEATFDEETPWEDRLERIENSLAAQQGQAQVEELNRLEASYVDQELNRLDPKQGWSDKYEDQVVRLGFAYADQDGIPDLEIAHKELQGVVEEHRERWVQSKRTPQVQSGASASQEFDLDDKKQRRDYMARRLRDMSEAG